MLRQRSLLCHKHQPVEDGRLARPRQSPRVRQWLKSRNDSMAQSMWLDGLRRLLDDSQLLAADPLARGLLALAETLALPRSAAGVECDVDHSRIAYDTMAAHRPLHHSLDVDSRHPSILDRPLDLLAIRKALQPGPTRRPTRGSAQPSRTAVGNIRNSQPSPPSGLSRTPLRATGVERGHQTGSLLCLNRVRCGHGRDHDSIGRRGTRATIRKRIRAIQNSRACYLASTVLN
jgi:hypothetical protein